jgi:hypothetical protein
MLFLTKENNKMRTPLIRNRRAMDAEIEGVKVKEFVDFLRTRLSPEDFKTLKKMVGEGEEEMGEDSPPSFKGMPKAGGSMASDSALKDFASRFPMAMRIGII